MTDWNNKEEVLEAVKDGWTLAHANKELRGDKEVVLAAVKRSGYELEYASEELRNDKEIFDTAKESLMEVVKRSGYALEYVSEELKNDKEMVLAAMREDGSAIKYASEELKNDPEFMKEVEQVLESTQDESTQEKLEPQPLMKYQIKDIKEGVEFIIDDDKTFDELIEFYLPFRLSELSSLDPSKPGDYDSSLIEAFFRGGKSPEIEDWADKVVGPVNWRDAIRLYVALATYADKNKADRVLALDIIYCLIGLNNQSWTDLFDKQEELSNIEITEQVTIQWGDYEVAKFLAVNALEGCYTLFDLEDCLDYHFFGTVSDLVGVECYFDRISEMIEEDKEHFFGAWEGGDFDRVIDVAKKSLDYLDDDTWARELYKKTLEVYDITDPDPGVWVPDPEYILEMSKYILEMSKSIIEDLKDKKWGEELANSLSIWSDKEEVLAVVKQYKYALRYADDSLKNDPEFMKEVEQYL